MFIRIPALLPVLAGACTLFAAMPAPAGPVNINTADAATLARELKGVGLAKAQAIVEYRLKYGPFRSADELALVKGIGPKAIEANRADIRVETRPAQPPPPARPPARPASPAAPRPGDKAGSLP